MDVTRGYAHWLLRLPFAGAFAYHGVTKFTEIGIGNFAEMMGIPEFVSLGTACFEIGAALLIIAGGFSLDVFSRLAGLMGAAVMVGAIAKVHWPRWSFTPAEGFPIGGMEFQVTLLCIGLYFALRGNGSEPQPGYTPQKDHASAA